MYLLKLCSWIYSNNSVDCSSFESFGRWLKIIPTILLNEFDCHFWNRKENLYKMLETIPSISLNEFDGVLSRVQKESSNTEVI